MLKKAKLDFFLLGSALAVTLAGVLTLYSQEKVVEGGGSGIWFRQLVFFLISLVVCLVIYRRVNYQRLSDIALPFYLIAILLLLVTLVPFIGTIKNGARSWIRFGGIGLQTSEVAKLALIVLLARYLELKEKEMDRIPTLLLAFAFTLLPMLLVVVQPDFGSAFIFAPILLTMLFMAGADIYHIGSVIVFFGLSLSIPLYIEYHKITLVDDLLRHLNELGKMDLAPAVRILKSDIWNFLDLRVIPDHIKSGNDRSYLTGLAGNPNLFATLREAGTSIQNDVGGLFLRLLRNKPLLLTLGSFMSVTAFVLAIVRFTQGPSLIRLRKYYIPLGVLGISLLTAVAVHATFSFKYYQVVRVTSFINPDKFSRDEAYQILASKAAIGSGQIAGRGIFRGDMTMGERPLVPESSTDFIFTSWGERTGFLGSLIILILLLAVPLRGLMISFESRTRFGSLLAAGISSMIFYHIVFNAGIALGLLPVTGLPLSFMSYGGSHLFVCMIGVGILLSIHRRRFAN